MRADMIAGLRLWRDADLGRDMVERRIEHDGWSVESRRAPLGVVAFVFEGRPNVFADAAGVVRTGNTVVFRIGSDALGTARAIVGHALGPALARRRAARWNDLTRVVCGARRGMGSLHRSPPFSGGCSRIR